MQNNSWQQTSQVFKAQVIGKLLGDGSIVKEGNKKPRFKINHVASDYEWIFYNYLQLRTFLPLNRPVYRKVPDVRLKKGFSECYYCQSKTSESISYLYHVWYPNGKKKVPYNQLEKYFNIESLAWWYMDDGHLKKENNIPRKIILSTESFTEQENAWLIEFLYRKYNLSFKTDQQNRLLLYDQFQIHYFLYLITPYLHHSMYPKILLYCNLLQHKSKRRTTIYLPTTIKITSPTKDINRALANLNSTVQTFKQENFYQQYSTFYQEKMKSYQITIDEKYLSELEFLSSNTGLTYSNLAQLCFVLCQS